MYACTYHGNPRVPLPPPHNKLSPILMTNSPVLMINFSFSMGSISSETVAMARPAHATACRSIKSTCSRSSAAACSPCPPVAVHLPGGVFKIGVSHTTLEDDPMNGCDILHQVIRIYVCTYVRTYVRTYVCMYVCLSVCMYLSICVCWYVSMLVCMYVRMSVCVYVCMCVCMYVGMYVCMCVCVYVYTIAIVSSFHEMSIVVFLTMKYRGT